MKVIVCKDYDEMSKEAAQIFIKQIQEKHDSVLGLATGSSPIGMYKELIKANKDGSIAVSYTHLTLPTTCTRCRSRWSPYH